MCKLCLLSLPWGKIALRQKFRLWKSITRVAPDQQKEEPRKKRGERLMLQRCCCPLNRQQSEQKSQAKWWSQTFWDAGRKREAKSRHCSAQKRLTLGRGGAESGPDGQAMRNYCHYRLGRLHATRQVRVQCENFWLHKLKTAKVPDGKPV